MAVQCGDVHLGDLLLPLVAHAVASVLWIPYPADCDKQDDWFSPDPSIHFAFNGDRSYSQTRCEAFLMQLRPPSAAEIRRLIRMALREISRVETAKKER